VANPSTTGPSGIGSEVLRRTHAIATNNTTATLITVGTDMIVTLLSLVVTNTTSSDSKNLDIKVSPDGSGDVYLYQGVGTWGAYETFVYNDKIVLTETDVLKVTSNSTDFDCYVSYIEQEFA